MVVLIVTPSGAVTSSFLAVVASMRNAEMPCARLAGGEKPTAKRQPDDRRHQDLSRTHQTLLLFRSANLRTSDLNQI